MRTNGYCSECTHSKKSVIIPRLYCHLTDELVNSRDNCGMYDNGENE